MTTDKNNTAPDPKPAERANASVVEQIAQQWDGCQYDAPGEMVDIGAAIRRAGKRLSAELAEQQGVNFDIDDVRELFEQWAKGRDLTPDTWGVTSYVSPHVDNDFDVWRAAWKALAATGKQQVGEVHGDMRALIANWRSEAVGREDETGYVRGVMFTFAKCADELEATFAARQPGAQVPEVEFQCRLMDVKTDLPTENWHHSPTYEENPGRGTHYWVQFRKRYIYYTPPAHGIDLHRLVPPEWLSEQLGGLIDDLTPWQAWRQGFNQCRARALLLVEQAMGFPAEQQCDAVPGVDRA
ncbi:hypothetical protein ACIGEO_02840 [Stenotrophomonas bentonitica]|uniref:hypothetical protein n=1 Tax=Stenotrophomonas bentonitica TaxID=1450134 RepID=UPI0037D8C2C2